MEFRSYGDAYNFLLEKFQERGFLTDVNLTDSNDSVSVGDMSTLRNALGDMAHCAAELSQLNAYLPLDNFRFMAISKENFSVVCPARLTVCTSHHTTFLPTSFPFFVGYCFASAFYQYC